jgi:translation initiation factor IF-3
VDENGAQLGVMPTREALEIARERGLDLIEVAPTANPPVCRLMDYGKFKYEQGRKDREAQKKQKNVEVKGIRLRPKTGAHDLGIKKRQMLEFLRDGDKVKVTLIFRAREITHPEVARKQFDLLCEGIEEVAIIEKPPTFEGRTMTMVLAPKPVQEREKAEKAEKAEKPAAAAGAKDGKTGKTADTTSGKSDAPAEPAKEEAQQAPANAESGSA